MSTASTGAEPGLLFLDEPLRRAESRERFRRLVDLKQPVFHEIAALVAKGDAGRLSLLRSGENQAVSLLNRFGGDFVEEDLGEPFRKGEAAIVHGMRALACLGLALVGDEPDPADLRAVARWYRTAGVSLPTSPERLRDLAAGRKDTKPGPALGELAKIAAEPGLDGPAMVAAVTLLALADPGAFPRRRLTPSPQIGVLFAGGGGGRRASLQARLVRDLPGCLVPDPSSMALFTGDEGFQRSLAEAWRQARGAKIGGAVLWSLKFADEPVHRVGDESLGGALTTVFNEVRRNRHRPVTIFLAGLRDRTAIVGRVSGAGLYSVGGYDDKLRAAEQYGRVILPKDDVQKVGALDKVEIVPVGTWAAAAWRARRASRREWAIRAGAAGVAVAIAVGATSAFLVDDARTRRVAARVAARAGDIGASDPSLAALLALAAHELDDSEATSAAMARVSKAATLITRKITAHPGGVTALTQAADSTTLYSAGRDGTVAAWNMRDGRLLARHRYGAAVIARMVVDPSVPLLLSADERGGVQLWRTADGGPLSGPEPLAEPEQGQIVSDDEEMPGPVGLGFLAGGSRAYAITSDGSVRIWDVITHQLLKDTTVDGFAGMPKSAKSREISAVAQETGVPSLAVGGAVTIVTGLGEIVDLDMERQRAFPVLSNDRLAHGVTAIAARPDDGSRAGGRVFAIGTVGGAFLLDAVSNSEIPSNMGVTTGVTGLRFGFGGNTLAIGTEHGVMMARTSGTGADARLAAGSTPQGGPTNLLAVGGDATGLLAAGHGSGLISILDMANRRMAAPPADASTVLAFDQDGRMLVTGPLTGVRATGLRILKPSAGPEQPGESASSRIDASYPAALELNTDPWWLESARFFSNDAVLSRQFAVAAGQTPAYQRAEGVVLVWDARTGETVRELRFPGGQPDLVTNVRLVPEMSALVARNSNGVIRAWSTRTWDVLFEMTVGKGGGLEIRPGTATAVLPVRADARGTPSGGRGSLAFVDLKKRKLRVEHVPGAVYRTSYTPDGKTLATLSADNRLRLLDGDGSPKSGGFDIALPSFADDIAVDPTGRRVAVSLADGQTLVYKIATGTLAIPPLQDVDGLRGVRLAWDPRSDLLAVGTMDESSGDKRGGKVNLWHTGAVSWHAQLCALAGRDITRAEWRRYIPEFDYRSLCRSGH